MSNLKAIHRPPSFCVSQLIEESKCLARTEGLNLIPNSHRIRVGEGASLLPSLALADKRYKSWFAFVCALALNSFPKAVVR